MEVFKEIAKGMSDEEKAEVLKTIPTTDLIDEVKNRVKLLEIKEDTIKNLLTIN